MKELNAKQERFCQEYLVDLNATQAAIRAGYSAKTAKVIGCENLTKPNVERRIAELQAKRAEKIQINAEWVLAKLVSLHEKCMEAEPVQDGDGNEVGYAKFNPSSAAKALELIGKHINVRAFDQEAPPAQQPIHINVINPNG